MITIAHRCSAMIIRNVCKVKDSNTEIKALYLIPLILVMYLPDNNDAECRYIM